MEPPTRVGWMKSSFCNNDVGCVEMQLVRPGGLVHVKDALGTPPLVVRDRQFAELIAAIKADELLAC